MAEFGVRHERAVDEEARADAGPERQHHHHTVTGGFGPETHFGETGRIGVVDHVNGLPQRLGEDRVGIHLEPRLVDVRGRPDDAAADDRREGAADRAGPVVVANEFDDDLGHCLRCCRLRRVDPVSLGDEFARREIDRCRLHAAAADVDSECVLRVRHGGKVSGRDETFWVPGSGRRDQTVDARASDQV